MGSFFFRDKNIPLYERRVNNMDGSTIFALVFISVAIFGPLVIMFLDSSAEVLGQKIANYINSQNNKEEES